MPKLPSLRITLKETRGVVRAYFLDMSNTEIDELIDKSWRAGVLPLYDPDGEKVQPGEKRDWELDFENSKVQASGQCLVLEGLANDAPHEILLVGNVQEVFCDRRDLKTLLEDLKSLDGQGEAEPRRVGRPSRGDKMKETFHHLKDSQELNKSMTKKVIHNLVLKKMFGSAEPRPGYSYDSFIKHVGREVDAWLSEKDVAALLTK